MRVEQEAGKVVLQLVQNLALLVMLAVGLQMLAARMERWPMLYRVATGLLFGTVGIVGMMTPMRFAPGVIYDGRSIVLSLAGLFGGPIAAALATVMCGTYRLHLGGAGVWAGIGTIVEAAVLGTILYELRHRNASWTKPVPLLVFAVLVHVIMLVLQVLLIPDVGWDVLYRIGPSVLFFYPLAFLLIVQVFLDGEHKRAAEQGLRASETKYRELVENANSVILRLDPAGRITFFNEYASRFLGFSREEVIGRNILETILPATESTGRDLATMIRDILTHPELHSSNENENIRKDGTRIWMAWTNKRIQDEPGKRAEILCVGNDITERKRAEAALIESESRWQFALEGAGDGVWDWNAQTNKVFFSRRWKGMLGYADDEIGDELDEWDRRLHPEDREQCYVELNRHLRGESPIYQHEYRLCCKDGTYRWILDRGKVFEWTPDGKPLRVLGTHTDITERKWAEEALAESERLLRSTVNGFPIPAFMIGKDHRVLYWNKALEEISGVHSADVVGTQRPWTAFYAQERPCLADLVLTEDSQGVSIWYAGRWSPSSLIDGAYECLDFFPRMGEHGRWLCFTAAAIRDSRGEVVGAMETLEDITERKHAEEELRKSEEKYRSILETTTEWIWEMDLTPVHTYSNPGITKILGYLPEEVMGGGIHPALHEEDQPEVDAKLPRLIAAKQGWTGWILRWRHKDGSYRYLESNATPMLNASGELIGYRGADRDVTERIEAEFERKRLETQLQQAQKMEAVGQLAGGIAHDFNNLMQVILAQVDLSLNDQDSGGEYVAAFNEVRRAAERAAGLTRQLLAFSRRQIIQPVDLDLNELVQSVLNMINRVIGEHIQLRFLPGGSPGAVHVDRGQIEQVLMNLCVNARDAMPAGGTLTIETGHVTFEAEYCSEHCWAAEGQYVVLSVTDTGIGMDEATRTQVFDPFFTTKEVGRGTGLGLATVYGIVKQHNGLIHVYSEPQKGTAFKIYLPMVPRPVAEVKTRVEVEVLGGTATILVAEDEESVRKLVSRMLESSGYTVLAACDGEEALRIFGENADTIDLALLDVVMPRLGGREVMERIHVERPRVRFLFSSGYSESAIHTNFVIREGLHLISKPYSRAELLRAVHNVLSEER